MHVFLSVLPSSLFKWVLSYVVLGFQDIVVGFCENLCSQENYVYSEHRETLHAFFLVIVDKEAVGNNVIDIVDA